MKYGHGVESENPPQAVQENRHGRGARQAAERLGLRARPGSVGGATSGEGHEAADDGGDDEEDRQREQVLAVLDRERVHGRREVPVDEQEADHGRGEGGPHAADGGDHDDEQQEQEEDGGELEVGAQVREDPA